MVSPQLLAQEAFADNSILLTSPSRRGVHELAKRSDPGGGDAMSNLTKQPPTTILALVDH